MQHTESDWKYNKYLSIKTLLKITLIRVSLCFERLQGIYFFYFIIFFCGIIKLICEIWHKFLINIWLRHSTLFLRNLHSVAGKITHCTACGNTYAHPPPPLYTVNSSVIPNSSNP